MCDGRIDVIQTIHEAPLEFCPWCGLPIRRIVSRAVIKLSGTVPDDKTSRKGFTTFRRAERGVWEKIAGEGPDLLAGTKEDMEAVDAEKTPPKKVIDLDADSD